MPDFSLREVCEGFCISHPLPYRLGVALSGGMDSVVLLHYLVNECRLYPEKYTVVAYHVHHGLNPAADQWARFCVDYAESLGVSCEVYRLNASEEGRQGGQSLEQWAREARYSWLASRLVDVIFLGHHQYDQAETVLLQLFRGTGIAGLAAMPVLSEMRGMYWVRPFLTKNRSWLEHYAQQHGLAWVEDPSNVDQQWERNWLRHTVMPMLRARHPQIDAQLARTALHCAEYAQAVEKNVEVVFEQVSKSKDRLYVNAWLMLDHFMQKQVFRAFFRQWVGLFPSTKWLDTALKLFTQLYDAERHQPMMRYQQYAFSRWDDAIWVHATMPDPLVLKAYEGELCLDSDQAEVKYILPHGYLRLAWAQVSLVKKTLRLQLNFRQGGERVCLSRRHKPTRLKELWYDASIPPWERIRSPILRYINDDSAVLVWVPCKEKDDHFSSHQNGEIALRRTYSGAGVLLSEYPVIVEYVIDALA